MQMIRRFGGFLAGLFLLSPAVPGVVSRIPLAYARGSEMLILSRDGWEGVKKIQQPRGSVRGLECQTDKNERL